jgi:hypothetical protein
MLIGTIFTLFVLPSIYMVIARDRDADEAEVREDELLGEAALEPVGA